MRSVARDASLSEKTAVARAKRLDYVPAASRRLIVACWVKKASPRQAIKAFCQECVGYERRAVTDCTAYACALWSYRPYQKTQRLGRDQPEATKGESI